MKLTKSKLKEIIREEIQKLNEAGVSEWTVGGYTSNYPPIDIKKRNKNQPLAKAVSSIKNPKDLKKLFPQSRLAGVNGPLHIHATGEKDTKGDEVYANFYLIPKKEYEKIKGKGINFWKKYYDSYLADKPLKYFPASIDTETGEIKL